VKCIGVPVSIQPLERLFYRVAVGYAVDLNHGDILPARAIAAQRQYGHELKRYLH
jgi:hypothetical protein